MSNNTPPWTFNLEGTLLGFLGNEPDRPMSLILEVDREQIPIALPQRMRSTVRSTLRMGDRIRCIGRSQLDFIGGVVHLNAYEISSMATHTQEQSHRLVRKVRRFSKRSLVSESS
ncbi:MAG: hypothetical protein SWY16_09055 [Cyanobacteriota bacterium]|nr:hypothetical protein [Cyanobacteriota bacterium]